MNKIKKAITEYWGPQCPDFNSDCYICQAWVEYNRLKNSNKLDKQFGRCPECDCIVSLDKTINSLCDRCHYNKMGRYRCSHCDNIIDTKNPKNNCCIWCKADLTKDYL